MAAAANPRMPTLGCCHRQAEDEEDAELEDAPAEDATVPDPFMIYVLIYDVLYLGYGQRYKWK